MGKKNKIVLLGGLLLAGLALLLAGQAWLGEERGTGTWSLAAGVLLLVGAAALACQGRAGRRRQPRLVGEYRGVLASEAGFVPLGRAEEEHRQQVQRRIVGRPERAADSVRSLLEEQGRQAKAARSGAAPSKDIGKRRKSDG